MRTPALALVAAVLLLLESALWRFLPFELVSPDLWALFALYAGLHAERPGGAPVAAAAALAVGFGFDTLAGAPLGLYASASVVIALASAALSRRLFLRGRLAIGAAGFLASTAGAVVVMLLWAALGGARLGVRLWPVVFMQGAMSALFAPLLFWLFRRVEARASRQRARDLMREGVLR